MKVGFCNIWLWMLLTFTTTNCLGQIQVKYGHFIPGLFEVYNQFRKFNSFNASHNQVSYGCFYREELPVLKIRAVRKMINTDPISYTLEQYYYDGNGYITQQIGYSVIKKPARDTDHIENVKFSYTDDKRFVTARALVRNYQKSYNQYTIYHVNDSMLIDTIFGYNDSLFKELKYYTILNYDSLRRFKTETRFDIPGDGRLVTGNIWAKYIYLSNENRITEYTPREDRYVQERMRNSLMKHNIRDSLIDIVIDSTKWGHHVYWSIFDEARSRFVGHYIETNDMLIDFVDPSESSVFNQGVNIYFKSNNNVVKFIHIEFMFKFNFINSYGEPVRVTYFDNTPNKEKWYSYAYKKEENRNGQGVWKKFMLTKNGTLIHGLPASLTILMKGSNKFSPLYINYTYE